MKKRLALMVVLVLMITFTACEKIKTTNPSEETNIMSTPKATVKETTAPTATDTSSAAPDTPALPDPNGQKSTYNADYINEHLKGDYSITYKMDTSGTGETTSSMVIQMIYTKDGYYISLGEGTEMLYIKEGDKYKMYMGSSKTGFQSYGEATISEEDIKSQAGLLNGFMTVYYDFDDKINKVGTEKVAGRDCDKYVYEYEYLGEMLKYGYCIDQETGVCMKFYVEGKGQEGSGQYTFECLEFKTSGVTLPKHN